MRMGVTTGFRAFKNIDQLTNGQPQRLTRSEGPANMPPKGHFAPGVFTLLSPGGIFNLISGAAMKRAVIVLVVFMVLGLIGTMDRIDQEQNDRLTAEIVAGASAWAVTK